MRAPSRPVALAFLGAACADGGCKLREAQKLLERAFGLKPVSGEIADRLGSVYLKAGRLDDAQRLLERAERLAPEAPEVAAHLGDLFLARGDLARALACYRRALGHRPDERLRHAVEEQLLLLETGRVGAR
jgi:tetratricopeptide (TPR) repeat protein